MANKIAVRIKPLKQWSDVSNATRHGAREDPAKHVDRSRTELNMHWRSMPNPENGKKRMMSRQDGPVDIAEAFRDLAEYRGAKWRKGAIVGTEMLFIASPGFFGPPGQQRDEKARKWAQDCMLAAMKRYPRQIAACRLDLDETTPHFSVFLLPMYQKEYAGKTRKSTRKPRLTISHNQTFGTPESLSALQDWAAEAMQEAGHALERGEPKATKGPDHTTPAEGRRRLQEANEAAEQVVADAHAQATQIRTEAAQEATLANERADKAEKQVKAWEAHWDIMKTLLRKLLPQPLWNSVKAEFEGQWGSHPLNPNPPKPDPQPDYGTHGPSSGP